MPEDEDIDEDDEKIEEKSNNHEKIEKDQEDEEYFDDEDEDEETEVSTIETPKEDEYKLEDDEDDTKEEKSIHEVFVEPDFESEPTDINVSSPNKKVSKTNIHRQLERSINVKETIRTFDRDEITEINQYISTVVPYSRLAQLFTLTEKPVNKAEVFTNVFRIVESVKRYVAAAETAEKIEKLLKETEKTYYSVYEDLANFHNARVKFLLHRKENKILRYFTDPKTNEKINRLIDAFLVFAEKQELLDLDRVAGLDIDPANELGIKAMKEINVGTGEPIQ